MTITGYLPKPIWEYNSVVMLFNIMYKIFDGRVMYDLLYCSHKAALDKE